MTTLPTCPPWCDRHDATTDVCGCRYVVHARREHVLTATGVRGIEVSRFDTITPDRTVTIGPVEVALDDAQDAPMTATEAGALGDALHALAAVA